MINPVPSAPSVSLKTPTFSVLAGTPVPGSGPRTSAGTKFLVKVSQSTSDPCPDPRPGSQIRISSCVPGPGWDPLLLEKGPFLQSRAPAVEGPRAGLSQPTRPPAIGHSIVTCSTFYWAPIGAEPMLGLSAYDASQGGGGGDGGGKA